MPVNITAALRDMRKNLVEVKQIRWQDILKHKGNIKLGKTDTQGNWYGASTSDEKEIARLKKDGYKVMKEEVTESLASTYESVELEEVVNTKSVMSDLKKKISLLNADVKRGNVGDIITRLESIEIFLGKSVEDLKKTNESISMVQEGVAVDRRTVGFKAAMIRSEKAKKVREKAKLKKEKKKEQAALDARYEYDGEVDTVLASANKRLFGQTEDAAANANAGGGVNMAPNAGKKKKDKFKVVKHANY